MKRGELIYIAVILVGVMLPGILIFYMFNMPLIPPDHEPDPFNKFIIDNWIIISIISIAMPILTSIILRLYRDKILHC